MVSKRTPAPYFGSVSHNKATVYSNECKMVSGTQRERNYGEMMENTA